MVCKNFSFLNVFIKIMVCNFFRIVDLTWNKDEVVLLAFEFKSSAKVARLHVFNENFRPIKSCVLRTKENPRTLNILRPNLATVGYTFIGIVEFWDIQAICCLYVLRAHSASINTVLFNENSTQMYTASENRAIKVWNLEKIPQISEGVARAVRILRSFFILW